MLRTMPLRPSALLVALACTCACGGLSVTAVEPSVVAAGRSSEVTVGGRGFSEDVTFALEAAGVEVTLGSQITDETSAVATVPAATPAGTYTLVAQRGGERAELEGALAVVADRARLHFLDIGQGDATLVVAPGGETLLIDGGPPGEGDVVRSAIQVLAGGRLDHVVLTHYDADHLGGLAEVLAGPDGTPGNTDDTVPETLFAPADDGSCDSQVCDRFRATAGYDLLETPEVGRTFALGDLEVEVVASDGRVNAGAAPAGVDDNGRSVVVLLRYGGRRVVVLGDLTGGGLGTVDLETPLSARVGQVDVLRTAHHGSATSSPTTAVASWSPQLAVFSFGTDNAYCHPHAAVLSRVAAAAGRVVATGSGIVDDGARCDNEVTVAPANADLGLGDILLEIGADGALTLDGQAL